MVLTMKYITSSSGYHSHNACATICDCMTNLDRKFFCIGNTILGFIAEISLDLGQFYRKYVRDIVEFDLTIANILN